MSEPVPDWTGCTSPADDLQLAGRLVTLEPLSAEKHADALFDAFQQDKDNKIWDYLPYGPFEKSDFTRWVADMSTLDDPLFFAIRLHEHNTICGMASYLRIAPDAGSIEVGHINFAPLLQATPAATEVMFLMMQWAFEAGYRRYEWKCNALNLKSRRAAQRLGMSFEGIFRQAAVVKGRNRDTAWYAIIDKEWPAMKACFERWFHPDNFDINGCQAVSLRALSSPSLYKVDPDLQK